MHAIMGCLAGLFAVISGILYILSILSGKTRPDKATWLIWAVIDGIILESYFRLGARETIFVPCVLFTRAVIVAALLFSINGNKCKLNFFDKICLGGAAISLVPRLIFNDPFFTLVITLIIISIGAAPTIRKIWLDCGRNENKLAWIFIFASFIVNLFAVDYAGKNLLEMIIYPAGVFLIDAVIIFCLFLPNLKRIRNIKT